MRAIPFAILMLTFLPVVSAAQNSGLDPDIGNPGLGGKNTIQGRVYYPSGHPLDRRVLIKVTSVRGGPNSVMTDDTGTFTMLKLTDGTYNFMVDAGSEYETVTESVQLVDNGTRTTVGQTVFVQIKLKFNDSNGARAGLVNAELAQVPKPARDAYEQALAASRTGDHKKAVEQLKQAISLYPEFILALNELGIQYLQLNELDRAAESLQQAVKHAPESFLPRLNYGLVLLQQKKFTEAESELRFALSRNDSSAAAHEYRGRALIGLKRIEEAEKELRRALELGGDLAANAHRYLGAIYMQRGDDARAIAELQEYLRLQPKVMDAEQIKQMIKDLGAKQ